MPDPKPPVLATKEILAATMFALALGGFCLVAAVLPAEYGIDPTGIGKAVGFTRLYQPAARGNGGTPPPAIPADVKILKLENGGSEPEVPRPEEADAPAPEKQYAEREDSVQVHLRAGKGLEYKVRMLKHGRLKYDWVTDRGLVYADFHGDVKQAHPPKDIYYESYAIANVNNMIGNVLVPYEGRHGWYFKNITTNDLTVSIRLKGQYELEEQASH